MKNLFLPLILSFFAVTTALANDSRAEEILKRAREAMGGERLQKIESLYLSGQYRRAFGDRQMAGDREISISLPDKYLVEDSMNLGGMATSMINTRGLNGELAWSGSSGGGGMMIRMASGPGGAQLTPEQMEAAQRRMYQAEFSRYLLAMILMPPPSRQVEFKYAGESDVEEMPADVVDVNGPDGFSVRLFFDKKSHLPLLLSYRGPKPRVVTMTRQGGGRSPDDVKKAREEAEKKIWEEGPPVQEEVDFFIRLTDHRKVDGVTLPYKFTFLTDSEVSEEFEISKYQLNPQFKADKFQKH